MKKVLAILLGVTLLIGLVGTAAAEKTVINLWTFTTEVPGMVEKFMELNPDFAEQYEVVSTVIATTNGEYQPALDAALVAGGADAPDFYTAESAFVLKYTQGDAYQFAAPYKDLGIDVGAQLAAADIAQYTVDI
ncbi:MAG: carbohydrate ABC transporter substrate-binding protein, partial [Desulfofustis sp.]|nr:carbohydrate ABC transporter substrate-binding protein [Desulfofustis sp.]